MTTPPLDCLRCGVCCFSPSDRFVRVTGDDWTRLGEDAERVAQFAGWGNEAFMRMTDGHCAALSVRPVVNGAGEGAEVATEFFCTIYERRPQICRDLARGSPECAGERTIKAEGLPPNRPTQSRDESRLSGARCSVGPSHGEQ